MGFHENISIDFSRIRTRIVPENYAQIPSGILLAAFWENQNLKKSKILRNFSDFIIKELQKMSVRILKEILEKILDSFLH